MRNSASAIVNGNMIADSQIHQFLSREARLMDEHRYAEWFELWAEDGVYWIPCNSAGEAPEDEVALIYDNYLRLKDRIARFESGSVLAQNPKSAIRRVISNVEVDRQEASIVTVTSNFILVEARGGHQYLWAGQTTHQLRDTNGLLRIGFKKVVLVNNDLELPLLQFLV